MSKPVVTRYSSNDPKGTGTPARRLGRPFSIKQIAKLTPAEFHRHMTMLAVHVRKQQELQQGQ